MKHALERAGLGTRPPPPPPQVKSHTKLEKVINAYCQKKAIETGSVR
jgi:hypothetical protein